MNYLKKDIKSLLFLVITFYLILLMSSISKCNMLLNEELKNLIPLINGSTSYIAILLSYISFITTLKFWQEKNTGAIDSLFSLPISIRNVLIAKVIFSLLVSIICFIITYIITLVVYTVKFNTIACLSVSFITSFIISFVISLIFNFLYGIINGFCMWQLSVGIAKFFQSITYIIFLGAIIGINNCITTNGINMNVIYALCATLIILVIEASYALILINKEKIILNNID